MNPSLKRDKLRMRRSAKPCNKWYHSWTNSSLSSTSAMVYHNRTLFIANRNWKQGRKLSLSELHHNHQRNHLLVTALKRSLRQRSGSQQKNRRNRLFQKFMRFMLDSISEKELDLTNKLNNRESTKASWCHSVKTSNWIYQNRNLQ